MNRRQEAPVLVSRGEPEKRGMLKLGDEVRIFGAVFIDCDMKLSGTIQGEVHCYQLEVEPEGVIGGKVVAREVNVRGMVEGEIYSSELTLHASCNVEADIYYRVLTLERGAFFEGKFRQSDDPLSLPKYKRENEGDL